MEFNAQQLLFEAFSHIICIFRSTEPQTELDKVVWEEWSGAKNELHSRKSLLEYKAMNGERQRCIFVDPSQKYYFVQKWESKFSFGRTSLSPHTPECNWGALYRIQCSTTFI